ncbi:MAG: ABC transporter ATP-binding protein [Clostridium sp.]|nr:ABC transporter ATP-binding protein [Clostridium sp.]
MGALVEVRDLTVSFPEGNGRLEAVKHMSFDINPGEIVGVVGESGSGKSMTALSIMGLLPKDARVDSGEIIFQGKDLLKMDMDDRRKLMGSEMGMVFQEPMTSLNPVLRIGDQVAENLQLHTKLSDQEIHRKVVEELEAVGLDDAEKACQKYPHELSGGQRQRTMLALAAICNPALIIADEPTTALDVVVQEQILKLLQKVNREKGVAVLFISHNLNVIRRICEKVLVVYHGEIVEQGPMEKVMYHPEHEYTKHLVARIPKRDVSGAKTDVILSLDNLNVFYDVRGSIFKKASKKHVLHDITFTLHESEILGIVGESGCGKSTLSKAILGLHKNYTGTIWTKEGLRPQMVFQDPYGSLNPARKVGWIMEEPLRVQGIASAEERKKMVKDMLEDIGLDESFAGRYPSELSGGQRQRISIGTALLMDSKFLIADEPVSALDVTVQSQIVKLLLDLHEKKQIAIMFISHDLDLVRRICRRTLVIYRGEVVEAGRSEDVYEQPVHPYTQSLLAVTKNIDDGTEAMSALPVKVPDDYPGCPFYPRCRVRMKKCQSSRPVLENLDKRHVAKCFRVAVTTE